MSGPVCEMGATGHQSGSHVDRHPTGHRPPTALSDQGQGQQLLLETGKKRELGTPFSTQENMQKLKLHNNNAYRYLPTLS
jgi:hypothetical protein